MNNTHGVTTGRYMREDRISAKAGTGIKRAVYAMIANTMAQWEGKRPRAAGKEIYEALVHQVAAAQTMQEAAAKSKAERLECHYAWLEGKQSKRKASLRARRKA